MAKHGFLQLSSAGLIVVLVPGGRILPSPCTTMAKTCLPGAPMLGPSTSRALGVPVQHVTTVACMCGSAWWPSICASVLKRRKLITSYRTSADSSVLVRWLWRDTAVLMRRLWGVTCVRGHLSLLYSLKMCMCGM